MRERGKYKDSARYRPNRKLVQACVKWELKFLQRVSLSHGRKSHKTVTFQLIAYFQ